MSSTRPQKEKTQKGDKKPWYMLRDSRGRGSVTVTLMLVSFWVTTFAYVASWFEKIGNVEFREFDAGSVGAYLVPILTLYFGRKWTDAKLPVKIDQKTDDVEE
jgi:hypothetical protein